MGAALLATGTGTMGAAHLANGTGTMGAAHLVNWNGEITPKLYNLLNSFSTFFRSIKATVRGLWNLGWICYVSNACSRSLS